MSRDIRSFFTTSSKSSSSKAKKPKKLEDSDEDIIESTPVKEKKKSTIINSDSEDDSKKVKKQDKHKSKKKKVMLSSDSEDDKKKKVKAQPTSSKLKPVDIDNFFGDKTIQQSKVQPQIKVEPKTPTKVEKQKKKKSKKGTELGVHGDADFEKTLMELDDDILLENVDILDKTMEEALDQDEGKKEGSSKENTPVKKGKRKASSSEDTPKKKTKLEHTDSGMDPGEEKWEKKRYSAMLYQKYLSRGGPKNHGSKEIPKGNPTCLKNLTFLRTGVLDSLESEEFNSLITSHGGRVVQAVSKKVNYLVVGEEPGPAKIKKAEDYGIKQISEDELLDMILEKSGMEKKFTKHNSEDTGIESGSEPSPKKIKVEKEKESFKIEKAKEKSPKKEPKTPEKKAKSKTPTKSSPKESKQIKDKSPIKKKPEEILKFERPKVEVHKNNIAWTEKYKPAKLSSVIGQQENSSSMNKLKNWLENWFRHKEPNYYSRLSRPSPWATSNDGAYFKAALLSGPPGIGKSTTASLVAEELGYDIVGFNAADTRSKKVMQEGISKLLNFHSIAAFAKGEKETNRKRLIIMDEVDGMSGVEDRGGMQELIDMIKKTKIPIICICNDRNHQKIRSLLNYCFDLKFAKPRMEQIRGAMMSICCRENIKMDPKVLAEIIIGSGCDIRQTLHNLAMWATTGNKLTQQDAEKISDYSKKNVILGPWEVVRKVFDEKEQKNMRLDEKTRLFFFDYSLGPLFVQENYIKCDPNVPSKKKILKLALAANSISLGDLVDSKIRGSNNWSLLEMQAFYSSVFPGYHMSGTMGSATNFPGWLGNNSKKNKYKRIFSELQMHTRTTMHASRLALQLDYLKPLRTSILLPLAKQGLEGVPKAVEVMKNYHLTREDLDNLVEVSTWSKIESKVGMNNVETKVKTAFTKAFNKEVGKPPSTFKKKADINYDEFDENEGLESDNEENDDLSKDSLISMKAKTKAKKTETKRKGESKGKGKAKKGK